MSKGKWVLVGIGAIVLIGIIGCAAGKEETFNREGAAITKTEAPKEATTPGLTPTVIVVADTPTATKVPLPTITPTVETPTSQWITVFEVNESQSRNNLVATILRVGISRAELLLPSATSSELQLRGLGNAKTVVGILVRIENRGATDVPIYPGGIDAVLLVGTEQTGPALFASDTGDVLLSGAIKEFQVLFPLKTAELDVVGSFRYKFGTSITFDFQVSLAGKPRLQ